MALARASCLYCGAPLPAESVAAATEAASKWREASPLAASVAPRASPVAERQLLILDLDGEEAAVLERALGLSAFEAEMRARRGGLQLHRQGAADDVREEAARLQSAGLSVFVVGEAEARQGTTAATGGRQAGGVLRLRTEGGALDLSPADLLLIVAGPIRREYQAREIERKRPHTATLEEGYRFHLHLRIDHCPVELDPASFAFGSEAPLTGSSLLELKAWLATLASAVPVDDGFKRLPPALGPAPEEQGSLGVLRGGRNGLARGKDAPLVLDNVAQFRFYSGWRAAIERRRAR